MIGWLIDNQVWVYVFLSVVALGLLVGLWVTRKREYAIGLGVVAAIALLFFLLSFFVETDQKRIVGAIHDMGAGVKQRNAGQIFDHISDQFRLGTLDKPTFRRYVEQVLQRGDVTEIQAWDFEDAKVSRPSKTATLVFKVKPKGNLTGDAAYYLCTATFVLEEEKHWRLKGFEVFNPFADSDKPMDIPQFIH